ncbi:MAG: LUD domain-containing protein [Halobacteriaceae archaeon]
MSADDRAARAQRIRELLIEEGETVAANTQGFNAGRYEAMADLDDAEGLRDRARTIKEEAIAELPNLLDELEASVEANGGTVHRAADGAAATETVRDIVAAHDSEGVVKSKSMTTEEVELNDALRDVGVPVTETDLGEFVIQLANEAPSHIVAPAIHRSRADIADLFRTELAPSRELETAADLVAVAREAIDERMATADVGVTGANFLVAETGSMALVTSEGNARKTVAGTDVHIAVAGIEKVIPSVADLHPFVELIARSGTGQELTSYLSLLTPPVDTPTRPETPDARVAGGAEDREFHLVLVDNGRSAMREDPDLKETLYCIRCSACLNSCANFQHVGGHAFGGETYSGGIGTAWEAGVESLESAASFESLCTGCSRCVNACPVKIDVPWLNEVVRDRVNRAGDDDLEWVFDGLVPDAEPAGLDLRRRLFGNIDTVARLASATAPLSNWLADRWPARAIMESVVGIDRRRALPTFRRETLVDWFAARGPNVSVDDARREVVLYPDIYTNYVDVARGKAAVRALEALGARVHVPALPESGRAPLSQGMLTTARARAERLGDELAGHLATDRDVVVVEPSDLAMFRRDYDRLLDENPLAADSYEIVEYVYGLLANGAGVDALSTGNGTALAYHAHCQQRTLDLAAHTVATLEAAGYDVVTSEAECCGMAGSFGYAVEHFDLSVSVGETLLEEVGPEATPDRTVVASGTSCADQFAHLTGDRPPHPVEVLAPDP